jgi:hypothetical protein
MSLEKIKEDTYHILAFNLTQIEIWQSLFLFNSVCSKILTQEKTDFFLG